MNAQPASVRFNVLRNALYHQARRRFLERTSRVLNLAIILLGAATVSDILGAFVAPGWMGLGVAVAGALQLVYDFSRRAAEHAAFQREYFRLLAEIDETPEPTPGTVARWRAGMLRITAEEPPVLRAVDAIAYNAAVDALELPEGERLVLPFWMPPLAHLCGFDGYRFRKQAELA